MNSHYDAFAAPLYSGKLVSGMIQPRHPVKARTAPVRDGQALPEEILVASIQAGDMDLVRELIRRHSDRLFLIIVRMVQSGATAEDILQETWIKVMRTFQLIDASRPIMPWLTRIALNCCRDHLRKERLRSFWASGEGRRSVVLADGKNRDRHSAAAVDRMDINRGLQLLSPKLRAVVVLKFYSGLAHAEIAEVLGIPEGTVKSRLNKALLRLRQYFERVEKKS